MRERIFRTDVDEAVRAAGRVRGDRHRLHERKWVLLHQHAVLERAGLRLVGVAHEVVRLRRLLRDRLPLRPCGKCCAAAAEQARVGHLAQHACGTELERPAQGGVTAHRDVRIERRRIEVVCDASQEAQARLSVLRQRRPRLRDLELVRRIAGDGAERGRRAVAQPETRARVCALRQFEAGEPAREIGADVEDVGRPFLERDQCIERRDAVRLGRWDLEAPAHVAERALRHPPNAPLRRAKCGQEEMPPRAIAARHAPVVERSNADHGIDRLALGVRRLSREQAQIWH